LAREARRKFWDFLADTKGGTLQKRSKNRVLSEVQNDPKFPRFFGKIKKDFEELADLDLKAEVIILQFKDTVFLLLG